MTDKRRAGRKRRDSRPVTNRALVAAAARLLDRLRKEPLPEDAAEAAALRNATRNSFLVVEELRTLAATKAQIPAILRPAPRKNIVVNRPFYPFFDEPSNDRDGRAGNDRRTFRKRAARESDTEADREAAPARTRA